MKDRREWIGSLFLSCVVHLAVLLTVSFPLPQEAESVSDVWILGAPPSYSDADLDPAPQERDLAPVDASLLMSPARALPERARPSYVPQPTSPTPSPQRVSQVASGRPMVTTLPRASRKVDPVPASRPLTPSIVIRPNVVSLELETFENELAEGEKRSIAASSTEEGVSERKSPPEITLGVDASEAQSTREIPREETSPVPAASTQVVTDPSIDREEGVVVDESQAASTTSQSVRSLIADEEPAEVLPEAPVDSAAPRSAEKISTDTPTAPSMETGTAEAPTPPEETERFDGRPSSKEMPPLEETTPEEDVQPEKVLHREEDLHPEEGLQPDEDLQPEEILRPEEDLQPEVVLQPEEETDPSEAMPRKVDTPSNNAPTLASPLETDRIADEAPLHRDEEPTGSESVSTSDERATPEVGIDNSVLTGAELPPLDISEATEPNGVEFDTLPIPEGEASMESTDPLPPNPPAVHSVATDVGTTSRNEVAEESDATVAPANEAAGNDATEVFREAMSDTTRADERDESLWAPVKAQRNPWGFVRVAKDEVQPDQEDGEKEEHERAEEPVQPEEPSWVPPRVTRRAAPEYPPRAHRRGVEGRVTVELDIDVTGNPVASRILRSSGRLDLDAAAERAAMEWRFSPARLNDEPVEDSVEVIVEFRLSD